MVFDSEVIKRCNDLDGLAGKCNVIIQQLRTFSRQSDANAKIDSKDLAIFTGRGLQFEVLDLNGKNLCNSVCLRSKSLNEK